MRRVAGWCALLALWAGAAGAETGLCRKVIDGDTLVVEGVGKVRLLGVDTPELAREGRKAQRGAEQARAFTRQAAQGKAVRLEYDAERFDKFGRTLAYVWLPDGSLLNRTLLERCLAEPIYYLPYSRKAEFLRLYKEKCGGR